MKYLRVALVVFASALAVVARAQQADQDEQNQKPPIEIPDFSNLDEYIYEPRSTVTLAFRFLSGSKASFYGHGSILSPDYLTTDYSTPNITRTYHDGSVQPDTRSVPQTDSSGNPILDPSTGVAISEPIAPDGRTNTWTMNSDQQINPGSIAAGQGGPGLGNSNVPLGYVAFHSYSAEVVDNSIQHQNTRTNSGLDLAMSHDMGKLWRKINWSFIAGMSVNDISAHTSAAVQANLTTITDLYSLYGQTVPISTLPYSAPSTTSQNVLDANGNAVTNSDGSVQTVSVQNGVLLGNTPAAHTTSTSANATSVVDQWAVKGAYFTFRFGPQISIPITSRFHAQFSAGPALVYAGTTYTVNQSYTPDIGTVITEADTDAAYKIRPGYFADASLQFDLTDKAGFFAGAVYQSASGYTQELHTTTADYATKIDLSNQNGLRAGMSIRF